MVVFLANRDNIRIRQLHRRLKTRFQSDTRFETVHLRVSDPREPGPYRVVAHVEPRAFLDDPSYPVATARLEIGFQLPDHAPHESYWINWIEPDRRFLLGWHQDDTHPDLGHVHVQLTQGETPVVRAAAQFIDNHPMAVVEARVRHLPSTLAQVDWDDGDAVGLNW